MVSCTRPEGRIGWRAEGARSSGTHQEGLWSLPIGLRERFWGGAGQGWGKGSKGNWQQSYASGLISQFLEGRSSSLHRPPGISGHSAYSGCTIQILRTDFQASLPVGPGLQVSENCRTNRTNNISILAGGIRGRAPCIWACRAMPGEMKAAYEMARVTSGFCGIPCIGGQGFWGLGDQRNPLMAWGTCEEVWS